LSENVIAVRDLEILEMLPDFPLLTPSSGMMWLVSDREVERAAERMLERFGH
jgi:hypothetical protein